MADSLRKNKQTSLCVCVCVDVMNSSDFAIAQNINSIHKNILRRYPLLRRGLTKVFGYS